MSHEDDVAAALQCRCEASPRQVGPVYRGNDEQQKKRKQSGNWAMNGRLHQELILAAPPGRGNGRPLSARQLCCIDNPSLGKESVGNGRTSLRVRVARAIDKWSACVRETRRRAAAIISGPGLHGSARLRKRAAWPVSFRPAPASCTTCSKILRYSMYRLRPPAVMRHIV